MSSQSYVQKAYGCLICFLPQEVLRRDWMFKLVGKETFTVGGMETKATVNIEAISGFTYEYTLEIDGKSLQKFIDNRSKVTKTWVLQVDGVDCRIVLGKAQKTRSMFFPMSIEQYFSVNSSSTVYSKKSIKT